MTSNEKPNHVGFILDGNRRWAKENGLSAFEGHRAGADTFIEVVGYAHRVGVKYVSAYIFSTENWKRTEKEVGYLMKLFVSLLDKQLSRLQKNGIRLLMLGSSQGLDKGVLKAFVDAEVATAQNQNGILGMCFNYGGHQEIVDASIKAMQNGVAGEKLTVESFEKYLYGPEMPPLDLVIRTSGEQRLSGFMLWRAAYAELLFINKHWPAFTTKDFDAALAEYATRQRRFGA